MALLQWFGAVYVVHVVKSASATNSVFAVVLGLRAFLSLRLSLHLGKVQAVRSLRSPRMWEQARRLRCTGGYMFAHNFRQQVEGW